MCDGLGVFFGGCRDGADWGARFFLATRGSAWGLMRRNAWALGGWDERPGPPGGGWEDEKGFMIAESRWEGGIRDRVADECLFLRERARHGRKPETRGKQIFNVARCF